DYTVIKAARVITISGEEFSPGIIVLEGDKISAAGKGIEYPPSAKVIDAADETVMPGFILPRSRHGLEDYTRSGVQGDQVAASEVYLSRMDFSDLLEAGYTTVALIPIGSDIPGSASVFRTGGADDSRRLADTAYLQVVPEWNGKGKENLRAAFKKAREEIEKVDKARKEWEEKQKAKKEKPRDEKPKEGEEKKDEKKEDKEDGKKSSEDADEKAATTAREVEAAVQPTAKAEPIKFDKPKEEKFEPPAIDLKYQPLIDLIQKKDGARMMVQLTKAADLLHFDDAMAPYEGVAYSLYLATAMPTDYRYVVKRLGERKARVVLRPWIHRLPQTAFRYNLAADLVNHGCEISLIPHDGTRDEYMRLRERLAELVRSGLTRKAAIESLTINPARVLGLEKKLGTIEKGKDADLVFFNGDPLDPQAKVMRVMILGRFVEVKRQKL
ncbi:MAG: amidohydrolase family protein, partial [Phycisphaerales bacterium]|nr:amidohydrolase family protein [Phycisphaerales bacterium]